MEHGRCLDNPSLLEVWIQSNNFGHLKPEQSSIYKHAVDTRQSFEFPTVMQHLDMFKNLHFFSIFLKRCPGAICGSTKEINVFPSSGTYIAHVSSRISLIAELIL